MAFNACLHASGFYLLVTSGATLQNSPTAFAVSSRASAIRFVFTALHEVK
jgi:hypothetical protein